MARPQKGQPPNLAHRSSPSGRTLTATPPGHSCVLRPPVLRVRVTTAGAKSFVFEAKLNRQTIRRTIGDVRDWDIPAAHPAARLPPRLAAQHPTTAHRSTTRPQTNRTVRRASPPSPPPPPLPPPAPRPPAPLGAPVGPREEPPLGATPPAPRNDPAGSRLSGRPTRPPGACPLSLPSSLRGPPLSVPPPSPSPLPPQLPPSPSARAPAPRKRPRRAPPRCCGENDPSLARRRLPLACG